MKQIVVLGAGFAGLIAAVGAARKLAELHIPRNEISVTVVNRDPWHAIRVRNYETDLSDVRVPLDDVLEPIGVDLVVGEVTAVDCGRHEILCDIGSRSVALPYDRLVFALGSELVRPPIPGLAEYAHSTSTLTMPRQGSARISPRFPLARNHPAGSRRSWSAPA